MFTVLVIFNETRTDYIVSGKFLTYELADKHVSELKSKIYTDGVVKVYEIAHIITTPINYREVRRDNSLEHYSRNK